MSTLVQLKRRSPGGAAGAPPSLMSGELAYNMADGYFYAGFGDNGQGLATSIKAFAGHDFSFDKLLPAGGAQGQVLTKSNASDYGVVWATPDTGAGEYHVHDAADITTGVFDIARIPVLPSMVQVVSSGTLANLDTTQQGKIGAGTIVTTTDGRRWVYSGSGSKTAEASYVVLADVTPEWTAIANKPVFATVATSGLYSDLTGAPVLSKVATSGSYADLSNKPTLGSMASQNAASVTITGGTINGVTLDGGTF